MLCKNARDDDALCCSGCCSTEHYTALFIQLKVYSFILEKKKTHRDCNKGFPL